MIDVHTHILVCVWKHGLTDMNDEICKCNTEFIAVIQRQRKLEKWVCKVKGH